MMQPDLSKWGWVGFGGVEKLGVKLARNHEFHFLFSTIIIMERQQNDRFGGHSSNKKATIGTELSKIIVRRSICDKKIPTETAEAVSEVLRMFVIEARARASIEAECDLEGGMDEENNDNSSSNMVSIRADHITKIAAEMLMDFS